MCMFIARKRILKDAKNAKCDSSVSLRDYSNISDQNWEGAQKKQPNRRGIKMRDLKLRRCATCIAPTSTMEKHDAQATQMISPPQKSHPRHIATPNRGRQKARARATSTTTIPRRLGYPSSK